MPLRFCYCCAVAWIRSPKPCWRGKMNLFRNEMKLLAMMTAVGLFGGGCLLIPHTTPRAAEAEGYVLDADTHAPVEHARVFLVYPPNHSTYTDANGHFHRKAVRNFHWAYVTPEGDWPSRKDPVMGASAPGHKTKNFSVPM